MSKHTPEPWSLGRSANAINSADATRAVARTLYRDSDGGVAEANAERIVACVNACKGLKDPVKSIRAIIEAGSTSEAMEAAIAIVTEITDGSAR